MCKIVVSTGTAKSACIKALNFRTKVEAVAYLTQQLNKILNNPNVKQWDVSMSEF